MLKHQCIKTYNRDHSIKIIINRERLKHDHLRCVYSTMHTYEGHTQYISGHIRMRPSTQRHVEIPAVTNL